jgi:hypothetical protein
LCRAGSLSFSLDSSYLFQTQSDGIPQTTRSILFSLFLYSHDMCPSHIKVPFLMYIICVMFVGFCSQRSTQIVTDRIGAVSLVWSHDNPGEIWLNRKEGRVDMSILFIYFSIKNMEIYWRNEKAESISIPHSILSFGGY